MCCCWRQEQRSIILVMDCQNESMIDIKWKKKPSGRRSFDELKLDMKDIVTNSSCSCHCNTQPIQAMHCFMQIEVWKYCQHCQATSWHWLHYRDLCHTACVSLDKKGAYQFKAPVQNIGTIQDRVLSIESFHMFSSAAQNSLHMVSKVRFQGQKIFLV